MSSENTYRNRLRGLLLIFLFLSSSLQGQFSGPDPSTGAASQSSPMQPNSSSSATPRGPSLGRSPDDASNPNVQQIIAILRENPDAALECRSIVIDRLREEGRQPPQGQLNEAFLVNEVQTDAQLRARIVQALQRRGLLPLQPSPSTPTSGQAGQNVVPNTPGNTPGYNSGYNSGSDGSYNPIQPPSTVNPSAVGPQQQPLAPPIPATPWKVEQPVPYGTLDSLRGLYTQVPNDTSELTRFGLDVFRNGSGNADLLPTDLPAGPDYVLGVGDGLNIHVWGSVAQDFVQSVDRSGRITLPESGSVVVAGQSLQQAQNSVRRSLAEHLRNVNVELSLTRVRTVRVYVVGDVLRPGGYDVSSLSTPLNALLAAGGPTEKGSLRQIQHFRGTNLVSTVDLYDLIVRGVRTDLARLEPGDTILVSPVGAQVTVAGMVRRPAIYEVKDGTSLAETLALAGGVLVSATLEQVNVERVQAHQHNAMLSLSLSTTDQAAPENRLLHDFKVQDGDRVTISPILPYNREAVYLDGHVFRPGKYAYRKGIQFSDLIKSYQDMLPEPAQHVEIVRLSPPEFRPVVLDFQLSDLLGGKKPLDLQPFDTIRIFGRYQFDAPTVTITGPVMRPGEYPLAQGMTASQLVRLAGGFKTSAFTETADIASYAVQNGSKIVSDHTQVEIAKAMAGDSSADVILKRSDVLMIRQLSGWQDVGAMVSLEGEVAYPGTYGIGEGEKLSSLIKRAGGFRGTAFPQGAVLERTQVRQMQEANQKDLIQRIESEGLGLSFSGNMTAQEQQAAMQSAAAQQKQIISSLQRHPPSGRLVITIGSDISQWENTAADIELSPGDKLRIPRSPKFVMVAGQVYSPSAMTYFSGRTAGFYLRAAGGFSNLANKKDVFIVSANGSVISKGTGFWGGNVLDVKLKPGDTVVVPEKIVGGSDKWRNLMSMAQVVAQLAIAASVATK